ncbi:MAG: hypothetical protein ABII85_00275 [Bacillota bacterium]
MWNLIKQFWGLIGGALTTIITIVFEAIDSVELVIYQKFFYLSSILLIWIGIWQALARRKKNKRKIVEKIVSFEKTNNLVQLARNPEQKGELLISTLNIIKIGGIKMNNYFKTIGWKQWVSLFLTVVLLAIGVASVWSPELAVVGQNLEAYFILLGLVSTPGIFARGKKLGDAVNATIQSKGRIKEINKLVKLAKKELDMLETDYSPLKPYVKRVEEFGGQLTAEQELNRRTYNTQRAALDAKIGGYNEEIKKLKEDA